jgi:hypothetical protein
VCSLRWLPLPVAYRPTEELLQRATNDASAEQRLIQRMRGLLAPFVLRRLKSELAEQMVTKSHKMHEVSGGAMQQHAVLHTLLWLGARMCAWAQQGQLPGLLCCFC